MKKILALLLCLILLITIVGCGSEEVKDPRNLVEVEGQEEVDEVEKEEKESGEQSTNEEKK